MARYLVTGGAGFIGSNIAEALVKGGEQVVVLDNLTTGYEKNIAHLRNDLTFIKGDVRDVGTVREALDGVDYVLHEAALASVPRSIEDPVLVTDVNVRGTLVMLDEARRAGVKRFVYAASSSAYGDTETLPKVESMIPKPLSPYAASKLMGEYYCAVYAHVYGMSTVSLRYFNIFGPRQDPKSQYAAVIPIFISHLMAGTPPSIFGDGEQSRDFTYIENVVEANILASRCEGARGQAVNIACGERYTLNDLFNRMQRIIGSSIAPRYAEPRAGDVKHSQADISEAEKLIGYKIAVPFAEGLRRTIAWYREARA
ncbi:MAG: SDR family oxidoreductase [Candidatus Krumholzibacteriia bacterium]